MYVSSVRNNNLSTVVAIPEGSWVLINKIRWLGIVETEFAPKKQERLRIL